MESGRRTDGSDAARCGVPIHLSRSWVWAGVHITWDVTHAGHVAEAGNGGLAEGWGEADSILLHGLTSTGGLVAAGAWPRRRGVHRRSSAAGGSSAAVVRAVATTFGERACLAL
jgi:hypothetical protein